MMAHIFKLNDFKVVATRYDNATTTSSLPSSLPQSGYGLNNESVPLEELGWVIAFEIFCPVLVAELPMATGQKATVRL